jgi:hypothetical protein
MRRQCRDRDYLLSASFLASSALLCSATIEPTKGNFKSRLRLPPDLDALFVYELQSKHSRGSHWHPFVSDYFFLNIFLPASASIFQKMASKDTSWDDILAYLRAFRDVRRYSPFLRYPGSSASASIIWTIKIRL